MALIHPPERSVRHIVIVSLTPLVLAADRHMFLSCTPVAPEAVPPGPAFSHPSTMVKFIGLAKRKEAMPLEEFGAIGLETHAAKDLMLPGLRRYCHCHIRDGTYALGEVFLDSASIPWFEISSNSDND